MRNFETMVQKNQIKSQEKVKLALGAIHDLLAKGEQVCVSELVKRTKLSRSFYYSNKEVYEELQRAYDLQAGKRLVKPKQVILDKAAKQEVERLRKALSKAYTELEAKDKEIADLKAENERLRKVNEKRLKAAWDKL